MAARTLATILLAAACALAAPAQPGGRATNLGGTPDPLGRYFCIEDGKWSCSTYYEIFKDVDPSETFRLALEAAGLPGGYAMIPGRTREDAPKIKPAGFKVGEVLEALAAAEPGYRIGVDGGVVNLLPAEGHPLLDAVIAEFRAENATVHEMIDLLKQSPEFARALKSLGVRELSLPRKYPGEDDIHGFVFICSAGGVRLSEKRYTVHCKGMTVLQVLNEIVRGDGCAMWMYKEWEPSPRGGRFYELGLLNHCPGSSY